MREKGYKQVIIGAGLIILGICYDIITIICTILLPFSFISIIIIVIGLIFVIRGALKKEEIK